MNSKTKLRYFFEIKAKQQYGKDKMDIKIKKICRLRISFFNSGQEDKLCLICKTN